MLIQQQLDDLVQTLRPQPLDPHPTHSHKTNEKDKNSKENKKIKKITRKNQTVEN